jgi:5-bromo-4-chloroindolyl phosphate hydrolysis protein
MIKKVLVFLWVVFMAVIFLGIFKFNFLSGLDGNKIEERGGNEKMHKSLDINNVELNDCEQNESCDRTTKYTKEIVLEKKVDEKKASKTPDFYKDLKVLSEKDIRVEVSRELKDCVGVKPQKCMQVRKEGSDE